MRNQTVAVVLIVAIALAFFAGFGTSVLIPINNNSTKTTSTSTNNSADLTTCVINAIGSVILQVVNSTSGTPIPSATVQAELLGPECPPNPHTTTTLSPMVTNSTGFVTFGGLGDWYVTVNGYGYLEFSTLPERTTCVTLGLPGGNTSITYSGTFEFSCQFGLLSRQ